MEKTIIIAEIKDTEKWYNVVDNNGVSFGVMKEKCPKLSEQIKNAKNGDQLTGNHVEKDGKHYLWDPQEKKGGKTFAAKDKSFEAATAAAQATAQLLCLNKEPLTKEQFDTWFDHIHAKIMSKSTKSTTESK